MLHDLKKTQRCQHFFKELTQCGCHNNSKNSNEDNAIIHNLWDFAGLILKHLGMMLVV